MTSRPLSSDAGPLTGPLTLVALSGNVRAPSRTAALVREVASAVGRRLRISEVFLSLADISPTVMTALTRDALTPDGLAHVRQVEAADILVVGSPIYRASYTGALKHLFDLVDHRALAGAVGVIAATGGTALHALATEHQFRPLFGFFRVIGVPTAIHALETDFEGTRLTGREARARVEQAAEEVAAFAPLAARRRAARRDAA